MPDSAVVRRAHRAVRRAVERHGLWRRGAPLVVGVSGGPDSLCLLGALLALRDRGVACAPGELVVAHLDHGLRGEAGAADAAWVRRFAEERGLACVVERADVRRVASDARLSLEDAARRVRYAFLRRVARDAGAEHVCVGHTQDDQAETVLMHFIRGAGLAGLAGMSPLEGDVARPLLDVTRAETEAYCAAMGWEPRRDPTNDDPRFLRNRVRRELVPLLATYNPRIARTLAENAALVRADDAYLDELVDAAWAEPLVRAARPDAVILSRQAFEALPPALRHRLLRRAAHALDGEEATPSARQVEAVDALLARGGSGRTLDLPGYLRLHIGYDTVEMVCRRVTHAKGGGGDAVESRPATEEREWPLAVPGAVDLPGAGWRVRAWHSDLPPGLEPPPEDGTPATVQPLARAGTVASLPHAEQRAYLDADATGDQLVVRFWRPGDRFQPLGLGHEKKLQDYFADAKVPRAVRGSIPLVANPRHIVWVAGLRADHRVRLTEATERILVLQLEPLDATAPPAS